MIRNFVLAALAACLGLLTAPVAAADDSYDVLPHDSGIRWHVWASEGPSDVLSGNQSYWGNRFRVGGETHFGERQRWILGLTFLDAVSSGESTPDVGGISRAALELSAGYFIVPNALWLMYAFHLEDERGSRISGGVAAYGHELSVGYRFYRNGSFNLSVDLSYLYVGSETVSVVEVSNGAPGTATFPVADVISLGLRFGVDFR